MSDLIRWVIFDVDGTLVDSVDHHARAWQQALAQFGIDVRLNDVRSQIGKGGDQLMPVFLNERQLQRFGKPMEKFRGELYRTRYLPRVKAFPKVRELFLHLYKLGVTPALATSSPEKDLEKLLKIAHIEDVVDVSTTKDDADKSKPHPDIFQAAMKRLGNPNPAEVLVVGDSPFDAIAARRIQLRTVGLLCGGFKPEELLGAGCVALRRDPEELLALGHPDAWIEEGVGRAPSP